MPRVGIRVMISMKRQKAKKIPKSMVRAVRVLRRCEGECDADGRWQISNSRQSRDAFPTDLKTLIISSGLPPRWCAVGVRCCLSAIGRDVSCFWGFWVPRNVTSMKPHDRTTKGGDEETIDSVLEKERNTMFRKLGNGKWLTRVPSFYLSREIWLFWLRNARGGGREIGRLEIHDDAGSRIANLGLGSFEDLRCSSILCVHYACSS